MGKITKVLLKKVLEVNDIDILLRDIRNLIDIAQEKNKFETLYFYCDWAAHKSIDRNKNLYSILEKINVGFQEIHISGFETQVNNFNYVNIVMNAMNLNSLIHELGQLSLENNFPISRHRTSDVLILILKNVLFKKIHYPESENINKNKKIKETIEKTKKASEIINTIEKYKNQRLNAEFNHSNPAIYTSLNIVEVDDKKLVFELEIHEKPWAKIVGNVNWQNN